MKRAMIVPRICRGCNPCVIEEICEKNAVIRESPDEKPWVDFYHCRGCLKCKANCPHGAIEEISQPCNGQRKMGW